MKEDLPEKEKSDLREHNEKLLDEMRAKLLELKPTCLNCKYWTDGCIGDKDRGWGYCSLFQNNENKMVLEVEIFCEKQEILDVLNPDIMIQTRDDFSCNQWETEKCLIPELKHLTNENPKS